MGLLMALINAQNLINQGLDGLVMGVNGSKNSIYEYVIQQSFSAFPGLLIFC